MLVFVYMSFFLAFSCLVQCVLMPIIWCVFYQAEKSVVTCNKLTMLYFIFLQLDKVMAFTHEFRWSTAQAD